jgi:prolycopene isomerase
MNGERSTSAYDVTVVSGGVGGLTVGALLAKVGKKVLVAEANEGAGGYARGFQRGPYTFDTAVHVIMGGSPTSPIGHGLIDDVLRHLGVRNRCEFVPVSPFYRTQFPDFQLDVPSGREAFIDAVRVGAGAFTHPRTGSGSL